jgi:hypothetical protein
VSLYARNVRHYSPILPKMPSDGSFHPSLDPRVSPGQTYLPHASARGSWDESPYNRRSESSSRSSWRGDSALGRQRSWGTSDQGLDLAYGPTGTHEEQRLLEKTAQLTQVIDQLLVRLEKVENRMSALEETLADGKASSTKKSGGGSKVGSNSHPLLKVSQHWRSCTSVI